MHYVYQIFGAPVRKPLLPCFHKHTHFKTTWFSHNCHGRRSRIFIIDPILKFLPTTLQHFNVFIPVYLIYHYLLNTSRGQSSATFDSSKPTSSHTHQELPRGSIPFVPDHHTGTHNANDIILFIAFHIQFKIKLLTKLFTILDSGFLQWFRRECMCFHIIKHFHVTGSLYSKRRVSIRGTK